MHALKIRPLWPGRTEGALGGTQLTQPGVGMAVKSAWDPAPAPPDTRFLLVLWPVWGTEGHIRGNIL